MITPDGNGRKSFVRGKSVSHSPAAGQDRGRTGWLSP